MYLLLRLSSLWPRLRGAQACKRCRVLFEYRSAKQIPALEDALDPTLCTHCWTEMSPKQRKAFFAKRLQGMRQSHVWDIDFAPTDYWQDRTSEKSVIKLREKQIREIDSMLQELPVYVQSSR